MRQSVTVHHPGERSPLSAPETLVESQDNGVTQPPGLTPATAQFRSESVQSREEESLQSIEEDPVKRNEEEGNVSGTGATTDDAAHSTGRRQWIRIGAAIKILRPLLPASQSKDDSDISLAWVSEKPRKPEHRLRYGWLNLHICELKHD
jgi:hypothetical protein